MKKLAKIVLSVVCLLIAVTMVACGESSGTGTGGAGGTGGNGETGGGSGGGNGGGGGATVETTISESVNKLKATDFEIEFSKTMSSTEGSRELGGMKMGQKKDGASDLVFWADALGTSSALKKSGDTYIGYTYDEDSERYEGVEIGEKDATDYIDDKFAYFESSAYEVLSSEYSNKLTKKTGEKLVISDKQVDCEVYEYTNKTNKETVKFWVDKTYGITVKYVRETASVTPTLYSTFEITTFKFGSEVIAPEFGDITVYKALPENIEFILKSEISDVRFQKVGNNYFTYELGFYTGDVWFYSEYFEYGPYYYGGELDDYVWYRYGNHDGEITVFNASNNYEEESEIIGSWCEYMCYEDIDDFEKTDDTEEIAGYTCDIYTREYVIDETTFVEKLYFSPDLGLNLKYDDGDDDPYSYNGYEFEIESVNTDITELGVVVEGLTYEQLLEVSEYTGSYKSTRSSDGGWSSVRYNNKLAIFTVSYDDENFEIKYDDGWEYLDTDEGKSYYAYGDADTEEINEKGSWEYSKDSYGSAIKVILEDFFESDDGKIKAKKAGDTFEIDGGTIRIFVQNGEFGETYVINEIGKVFVEIPDFVYDAWEIEK